MFRFKQTKLSSLSAGDAADYAQQGMEALDISIADIIGASFEAFAVLGQELVEARASDTPGGTNVTKTERGDAFKAFGVAFLDGLKKRSDVL